MLLHVIKVLNLHSIFMLPRFLIGWLAVETSHVVNLHTRDRPFVQYCSRLKRNKPRHIKESVAWNIGGITPLQVHSTLHIFGVILQFYYLVKSKFHEILSTKYGCFAILRPRTCVPESKVPSKNNQNSKS